MAQPAGRGQPSKQKEATGIIKRITSKLRKSIKNNRMTVRYMFQAMDTDGNGLLSAKELQIGLQPFLKNEELTVEMLSQIIQYVDEDGDSEVTFDEFDKALKEANDSRKDRIRAINRQLTKSTGFPTNINEFRPRITLSRHLHKSKSFAKAANASEKQSGRVICDDDPTAFWMHKSVSKGASPNITKKKRPQQPQANAGGKSRKHKYKKPPRRLYPTLYKNDRGLVESIKPTNILGRIKHTRQPTLPQTITNKRSVNMAMFVEQLIEDDVEEGFCTTPSEERFVTSSHKFPRGSTADSFNTIDTQSYLAKQAERRMVRSPESGQGIPKITDSWLNTWNAYTEISRTNPLMTLRNTRKQNGSLLPEIDQIQETARQLYNFEVELNAEEMESPLENMFAFSFSSDPNFQNGRPVTSHDGAVQLHVASQWKNGKIGEMVRLKRYKRSSLLRSKNLRNRLKRECRALKIAQHISGSKFIQKLRTVLSSQKEIVMVLESAPGGTLRTLLQLRGRKGTFSESQVRFYVAEIVAGVIHLHKRGILHRDLKMENILLNAKGHILIAGFELCLPRYAGIASEVVGTPQMLAPEIILGTGYGRPADYWSIGIMMYEMLRGEPPFHGDTPSALFSSIISGNVLVGTQFSKHTQACCESLLIRVPKYRLGRNRARGLQQHSFFEKVDWINLRKQKVPPPFLLATYTQTKDASEAYSTARQLGYGVSKLGEVRDKMQFETTSTPSHGLLTPGTTPVSQHSDFVPNDSINLQQLGLRSATTENSTINASNGSPSTAPENLSDFFTSETPDSVASTQVEADFHRSYSHTESELINIETLKAAKERPSTGELLVPFQMRLAEIQANKTRHAVQEASASLQYNQAITELAIRHGKKQVEHEIQKRNELEKII